MRNGKIIAVCASAALAVPVPISAGAVQEPRTPRIVGYLPDWSYQAYSELDMSQLTHINIAFCNPDDNGELFCYIPDGELERIVSLAHENGTEVFAALGGGGGCDSYLQFIDTTDEMKAFSVSIMDYCERYGLDGIDLDIELGSGDPIWNYYADWCAELRELCDERGMEMSTATAQWVAEKVTPETFALFDFVNVMAYDNDGDRTSHSSYEYAVKCLDHFSSVKKIPGDKLVLGVPFYGRGYSANGELDWNSYASFASLVGEDEANYTRDSYNGIAYNGAETIAKKSELAADYGGIMIWELTQDARGDKSLLKVIGETLRQGGNAVIGDVNGDGALTAADLVLLQRWLLGDHDSELVNWQAADLCSDGRLDTFDLCLMRAALIEFGTDDSIIVSDISELQNAVKNAKAGDVIKVAPGKYDVSAKAVKSEAEGTANSPITLTALDKNDPPVFAGSDTEHGYALHILGDYWILDSLILTNSQKGIVLDNSGHTVIQNCEIHTIGAEAIAIRDGSSYCTVKSCYIHDTGLVSPGYGEGVYIGSSKDKTEFDFKCDHNKVIGCTFKNVAAEHVDVKEYTTDTEICGCTFYGDGMTGANYAGSFLDLKGNDCYVHDNIGYRNGNPKIVAAFEVHEQAEGWGYHHVFENNTLYMDQPYGAENTSRRMYVVDGWFSDFSVKNNLVDYGNGLVPAIGREYYNSDKVTYIE